MTKWALFQVRKADFIFKNESGNQPTKGEKSHAYIS